MIHQLGLDTGGTYTDAVLVDGDSRILATAKSLTTHRDLITGLAGATDAVLAAAADAEGRSLRASDIASDIGLVSMSTTLATNALVEGRGRSVALVLVGFSDRQLERAGLGEALAGTPCIRVAGGHRAGGEPVEPLDRAALEAGLDALDPAIEAIAVAAVFAVRNPEHELLVRDIVTEKLARPVSCSHQLSSALDAPRRALTTLLNARLIPMIGALLDAGHRLLDERGIDAPLMVVKGDGSLVSADFARRCPVETILSGPAASVVGAAWLCDEQDLVVSDMGGTTTDIAMIRGGEPRLDEAGATVGGYRTMVRAVDVRTFGLGGDSAIHYDREARDMTIGPARAMPLSRLATEYPGIVEELERQSEPRWLTTHAGQFVLPHAAAPVELTAQQKELYRRIEGGPIALVHLFEDQSLERALERLEQRGIVLRASFTPSDAAHITGELDVWNRDAAVLGAKLFMRYAADNLGMTYADERAFARTVIERVARETSLRLVESMLAAERTAVVVRERGPKLLRPEARRGLVFGEAQRMLFERAFAAAGVPDAGVPDAGEPDAGTPDSGALVAMQSRLTLPVVGLGAPVNTYYPRVGQLLATRTVLPEHANVANALGAVVGLVRQQQEITIGPAAGERVRVMLPDGPEECANLEAGAALALSRAEAMAREAAELAGASDITVITRREDNLVRDGDREVFFESRITATASGRPALKS
ncbi:MAG: hydantoinase [Gammaproteobacteria bacterium]|nr:MAG: hydantoinase [Gammaproteobacteria bacterium]PIE37011.1 MAG: hydantoinase [Gammaproteobacteria bacterium]